MKAQQPPLFDVKTTAPKTCARGCTNKNLCAWAADKHHYGLDAKQPRTCLLRHDPQTAPIPF